MFGLPWRPRRPLRQSAARVAGWHDGRSQSLVRQKHVESPLVAPAAFAAARNKAACSAARPSLETARPPSGLFRRPPLLWTRQLPSPRPLPLHSLWQGGLSTCVLPGAGGGFPKRAGRRRSSQIPAPDVFHHSLLFSSQGGTPGEAREATGEGDPLEQAPAVFGPPYLSLSPVPARCMTGRKQPAVFSGPASLWFVFVVLVDRDLRGAPGCTVGRF